MRTAILIASTAATLLAGTTFASAQGWDDPPGWRFQDRQNRESNGQLPDRQYRSYGYYNNYGDSYAYVPGPTVVVPAPGYYGDGYYRGPAVGFGFRRW